MSEICLCLSCFDIFQHLVTFSIEEEDDLASVEDATRKLAVMDAQGKIWAQEMLLQVNGSAIKLFDVDSKVGAGPVPVMMAGPQHQEVFVWTL